MSEQASSTSPSTSTAQTTTQPNWITSSLVLAAGSAISVWLDQWSKAWAAKALYIGEATAVAGGVPANPSDLLGSRIIKVASWFNFRLVGNKGAAWGIFRDLPETMRVPFFVLLSAVALTVLLVVYYRSAGQKLMQSALVLIAGGAIGNLIDRIQIGYVVDFIDWHVNNYHWPTFNIADVSISVGVGLMIIDMIRQTMQEVREAKALRQQEPVEKPEDVG